MKKILLISVLSLCAMAVVAGYAAAATTISTSINTGGTLTVGADAAGTDVLFYTDVSGEELLWDASENMLTIDGANGANALQVTDGNVAFTDDLAVTAKSSLKATLPSVTCKALAPLAPSMVSMFSLASHNSSSPDTSV